MPDHPLPDTIRRTILPNGVAVVTEEMPHVRTAAFAITSRQGSRDEAPNESGLSHFLEHFVFRGTRARTGPDESRDVSGAGSGADSRTSVGRIQPGPKGTAPLDWAIFEAPTVAPSVYGTASTHGPFTNLGLPPVVGASTSESASS